MGAFIKFSLLLHGLVNICLGTYGVVQPLHFLAIVVNNTFDNSWLHIPSLDHTLNVVANENGFLLLALGAMFLISAGEATSHRKAAAIVSVLEAAGMGARLLSGGDGRASAYHGVWALVYMVAFYVDGRTVSLQAAHR